MDTPEALDVDEPAYIKAYSDNPRLLISGVSEEMTIIEFAHVRKWELEHGHIFHFYDKTNNLKFLGGFRMFNGGIPYPPDPPILANHPGFKLYYMMHHDLLHIAKKKHPEIFKDEKRTIW